MSVQIGAFTLQRRLGRGGMGEVWLATHVDQGVDVALKLMTSARATEERYREAFGREVRAVARLDHPAIVRVLDCGEVTEEAAEKSGAKIPARSPYLVMELATGTLRDFSRHVNRWPPARTILLRILDALAHAHARGVIHRDLKPENVLVVPGPEGPRLKLADFGLAHAYQHPDAELDSDSVSGTPRFMAPEQILGQWRDQGPWTDLYAVGCLAYWLVSGKPPYSGADTKEILAGHLQSALPLLQTSNELPEGTHQFFARLLAKAPGDRFQLASDAAFTLSTLHQQDEAPEPEPITFRTTLPALPSNISSATSSENTRLGPEDMTILLSETISLPDFDGELAAPSRTAGNMKLPPIPTTWERIREDQNTGADHLRGVGLGLYGLRQLPLVARIGERDALWEALSLVYSTGESLCISLAGTMGVGKTRLAEWLAERASEVGSAQVTQARHSPIEANGHGLATVVTNRLRCHGMSTDSIISRVTSYYARSGPLDADDLQDCTAITALVAPICDSEYDPEKARVHFSSPRERYALVARFLARTADARPLILLLDDVQWGHDTLQFLKFLLADFDEPLSILAVLTVRDDVLDSRSLEARALLELQETPGFETLEVAPLTENDHRRLVSTLLGLDTQLVEEVVERTRGNPLFAVQLVGDWVERGILIPTPSGFALKTGASARLPADIDHLLTNRIEAIAKRLAPDHSEEVWIALEVAAALGHEVDLREWKAACAIPGITIPRNLVEALTLARLATSEKFRFSFLHGAIRESLEHHARKANRWEDHHELCATALEKLYPPRTRWLSSRIGRHLLRGQRWEAALKPLLTGADEARVASEFSRAYDLFDRHLEAVEQADTEHAFDLRALNTVRRTRTLIKQNHLTEAADQLATLKDRGLSPFVECERLFALGTLARARGAVREGIELSQRFIELHALIDPDDPLAEHSSAAHSVGLAKAITLQADLHHTAGHIDEALTLSREGASHCTNSPHDMAAICLQMGNIVAALGDFDRSLKWLNDGRKAYEEVGDRYGIAQIENSFGELYRMTDRPGEALGHYEKAFNILTRVGVTQLGTVRFNIAMCLVEAKNFQKARRYFEEVHQALITSGSDGYLGLTHTALMTCAAADGDWDLWQNHLDNARKNIEETGLTIPDIAILYAVAMDLTATAGRPDDAELLGELAREQWTRLQRPDKAAEVFR